MEKNKFDISIIGGGPAGSSTAIQLAKAGLNICLFEKKSFPRDVLCGEFLSTEVIESLKQLNLYQKFLLLSPNKIDSFRFINEDSKELNTNFPFEAYAMKRSKFDEFLLNEAKASGVIIFQPAEVKEIKRQNGFFHLKIKNSEFVNDELITEFVIAAYGKQNALDKILERKFINEKSQLNGIKFYVDKSFLRYHPSNEIQIYASEGIYCGVNSVNENEVTLCFLEDRSKYSASSRSHLIELMERNHMFADLFNNHFIPSINEFQVYGTGNIYFGKKELVKDGIYMVGDAAGVIAPLAGDGIGMALETSGLISKILIDGVHNKIKSEILERRYISDWNNHFNKRLLSASILQKSILANNLRNFGIGLAKVVPSILPKIVQLTRGSTLQFLE